MTSFPPVQGMMSRFLPALAAMVFFFGDLAAESVPEPADQRTWRLDPFLLRGSPIPAPGGLSGLTIAAPVETASDNLRETFQRFPGLSVQESFGGFDPPRFSVRGSGLQSAPVSRGLALALNDFPLNFADGSFDLALIEGGWIAYAELTPGPAAGVPALGGALSMWSTADLFNGERVASASYGSDRTIRLSAQGSVADESRQPAWAAAFTRSDGWRDHSRQERQSLLAALRTPWVQGTEVTLQLLASRPRLEVPGPLTKTAAREAPRSNAPPVLRDRPRRDSEYVQLGGMIHHAAGDHELHLGSTVATHRDFFRQLMPNGIRTTSGVDAGLFGNLRRRWDSELPQTTDLGIRWQCGWWEARRYRNQRGSKGERIGDNRLEATTVSVPLDHQIALTDRQTVEVGASMLGARRHIGERFDTSEARPTTARDLSAAKLAPRLSWSWRIVEWMTLNLSWARSYEPPTHDDLLFTTGPMAARELRSTSLSWQRADSFEAGLSGDGGPWTWSSRVYYAPWRRELLRLADADGSPRGTVNAGDTLHMGWESLVEWRFVDTPDMVWSAWATYRLSEIRFDDDPVYGNSRLGGVPPHSGAAGVRGDFRGGWYIAPGVTWQAGPTYADHANRLSLPGFAVWSLDLGRRHPSGWEAGLRVRNLFDRRHIASTAGVLDRAAQPEQTAIFLPGTGRRLEAHLSYHW